MTSAKYGSIRASSGPEVLVQEVLKGGQAVAAGGDRVVEPAQERLEVRREVSERRQRRAQLAGGGPQLRHERVGVDRELLEPREGRARLAQEGREDAEDLFQLGVAVRGRLEDRVGGPDQPRELALALGQRVEDLAAVGDQAADGLLVGVEDAKRVCRLAREGLQAADRGRDVIPSAFESGRLRLHPLLEGHPRRLVEGPEDLVDLNRLRDLRRREGPVLFQRLRFLGAGRELDVRLAQERLLAERRLGVRRDRRVGGVELDRRLGLPVVVQLDRP